MGEDKKQSLKPPPSAISKCLINFIVTNLNFYCYHLEATQWFYKIPTLFQDVSGSPSPHLADRVLEQHDHKQHHSGVA